LAGALIRLLGPLDRRRLHEIREADRLAPYRDGYRENNLPEITTNLVRALYGLDPAPELLDELLRTRYQAFVNSIAAPEGVADVLYELGRRYRIGLVSNYPIGSAIRESLRRVGLADCFEVVVVSGDVGRIKPHPLPFQVALEQLGADPATTLHIGDNWLADVQGAKRLGMQVIQSLQYETPEAFQPQAGDDPPDATIQHLSELRVVLKAC
jgi:HAD superfamily hydrolase (TIGR01509 family)